ncbi:MAG: hypothetical protein IT438_16690 [Phycisphaerales bacterium]|nr:hypothetical protein [Phycisphaerales bacterium]
MRSPARSVVGSHLLALCGLAAGFASAFPAAAEPVQVVLASIQHAPASPKSAIPGVIPGEGIPGDPRFVNFSNKIFRSPTTNLWTVVVTTNLTPGAADQVLLIGQGLNIVGGQVAAREGVSATTAGDLINFSRLDCPRINDSGQWAMTFRPAAGGTTNERVVRWDGSELLTVFGPGSEIPAVPGQFFAGAFNGCNIANSGAVGFLATGLPTNPGDSAFGADGAALLAEAGISIPTGQSGTPGAWNDIDTSTGSPQFWQSGDGTRWIALGEVGTDTSRDKAAVVDGAVVVQEGSVLAGSAFVSPVGSIGDVWMESGGDWFVRAANADGIDWICRNGAVVAVEGRPIVPGSTELWQTFRDIRGNNRGDFVVSGNTNRDLAEPPDGGLSDDVLVLNGRRVIARESDPVDLDGNGAFDDSLFLHLIQDRGAFNNDGYFYFASRLKSAATDTVPVGGSANTAGSLLRIFACPADFNGSGAVSVQDIFDYLAAYFGDSPAADINNSGAVSVQDIFDYLALYFAGCGG